MKLNHDIISKFADKNWRLSNLYKIVDKEKNTIRFQPNEAQQVVNASRAKRKAILKARQLGMSTNEILKMADDTFFGINRTNVILSHEQDSIEKLFRIVKTAHNNMPSICRPELDRGGGSKFEMFFPATNSRIYVDLESRSDTISWLHVSEADFAEESRILATIEAVPLDSGIVTLETTPNGLGHYFHKTWTNPNSNYEKFFFPWYFFSKYKLETKTLDLTESEKELVKKAKKLFNINLTDEQIAFRRFKIQDLGDMFFQEYPEDDISCFLSSGSPAINLIKVTQCLNEAKPPIKTIDDLNIYRHMDKTKTYVIGVDTAEGVGKDKSAAIVLENETLRVVAVLHSDVKPYEFAIKLDELARLYSIGPKCPLMAIERNNHGHAVIQELFENRNYRNLFKDKDGRIGWLTSSVSRPIATNTLIKSIENNEIILDKQTLSECLTLIKNNGKIEASKGYHDDLFMAASIALQASLSSRVSSIWTNIGDKILVD